MASVSNRLAVENQLLAEEKWLIEAIKKVQTQRHSLQIERLHLQSLKSRLVVDKKSTDDTEPPSVEMEVPMMDLMQPNPSTAKTTFNEAFDTLDREVNEEELDLTVSRPMFRAMNPDLDMEEDDDDDEDNPDNFEFDMNMFMNSHGSDNDDN